jgi:thiol-disulfide isomerase/thioredoxin
MMSKFTRCAAAALVLCVGAVQMVALAEPDAAPAAPAASAPLVVDGKVKEVLDSVAAFYAKQKSVSVETMMSVTISGPMGKMDQVVNGSFVIERPNKFVHIASGETTGEQRVISNGVKLWSSFSFSDALNVYTESEAPTDFRAASKTEGFELADGGMGQVSGLLLLMSENGASAFTDGAVKAEYAGEDESPAGKVDKVRVVRSIADPMSGQKTELPIVLWVLRGDSPWLVRFVPDAEVLSAAYARQTPGARLEMDYTLSKWHGAESQPSEKFVFTPSEGATKVSSLREELEKPAAMALKGKPVVILDFWATWCGPCRKGLPVLNEVAQQFKDKGVVLYAVNLQEDEPKVASFMEKMKWDVKVLLDREGSMAEKFKVGPIPQTVYIGRDGVIHEVEVGLPSMDDAEMKKAFTAAIEEALKKGG